MTAAVLVAGLAIGYLAGAYATPSVPRVTAASTTIAGPAMAPAPPVTTSTTVLAQPLAETLPAVEGRNLLVVQSSGPLEVLVWHDQALHPRRLPVPLPPASTRVSFDSSGFWMAALAASPSDQALYAGNVRERSFGLAPVFLDVASMRWHPTLRARLAWTTTGADDGRAVLYEGSVLPGDVEAELVTDVGSQERLLAWGDWGFLVGETGQPCPQLRIIGHDGQLRGQHTGFLSGASGEGRLLLTNCGEDELVVSEAGFEGFRTLGWVPPTFVGAHWSPDGRRLALLIEEGEQMALEVRDLDGRLHQSVIIPRPLSVDWGQRELLVLAARGGRVMVVDVVEGTAATLDVEGLVFTAVLR
ncbi:MAG: hypothetical protein M3N51_03870 [Actinomycetota bacterium]|nr:hypothetical protein [Actinomycetota bacterium]